MTTTVRKSAAPVLVTPKVTAPARARHGTHLHELQCPECGSIVRVAPEELIEGATLQCRHCGIAVELRRDFDVLAQKPAWFLVDPLREADEREERRT